MACAVEVSCGSCDILCGMIGNLPVAARQAGNLHCLYAWT